MDETKKSIYIIIGHTEEIVHIPQIIKNRHTKIVISVDYMIVQNIAMLIAIDNSYQFRFLKSVHKRKANNSDI